MGYIHVFKEPRFVYRPKQIFMKKIILFTLVLFVLMSITLIKAQDKKMEEKSKKELPKTEEEWKKKLSPEEYRVLREKGTERPYVGVYDQHWEAGVYVCKGCGAELFDAKTKFDAGCGWPSFYEGVDKSRIKEHVDSSFGMRRVEVTCAACGGHLGHVFPDGPKPTGDRYCINSVSLGFKKKEEK